MILSTSLLALSRLLVLLDRASGRVRQVDELDLEVQPWSAEAFAKNSFTKASIWLLECEISQP